MENENVSISANECRQLIFSSINTLVTSETVVNILGCSKKTLFNMHKDNRLIPVNADSSKLLYNFSEVLEYLFNKKTKQ